MIFQRSRGQAPPLVLLFLLGCTIGPSDSNTTPESNFQTSTYAETKASSVDVHPFTDVPLLNSAIKSPSVDVTRNPNVLSVSQITSSSGVTSLTTTETLPSPLPLSSVSSSSSTAVRGEGETTPEVVVPSMLPVESSSSSGSDSISISVPHTIAVSTSVPSTDPLGAREPISNQPETDQENTDERPPASSSVGEAEIAPETASVIPMVALPSVATTQSVAAPATTASSSSANSIAARTMNQTQQPSATATATATTTTHEALINDVHVEKKLENGLYRIKLAEIITDQFNGGINQQQLDGAADEGYAPQPRNANGQPSGVSAGKINIADLYPLKVEDFNPIIRNSNEKLIREKNIYFKDAPTKWGQPDEDADRGLLSNSLDALFEAEAHTPGEHSVNSRRQDAGPVSRPRGEITDFTGKLLQEKDGVITEIEKKFRLDEFEQSTKQPAAAKRPTPTVHPARPKLTVNHQIEFIDRRVKKSFEFPLHRTPETARIGFANTKFKSDTAKLETGESRLSDAHPEFSTTKFYNSKELYNEMLQRKKSSAVLTTTAPPPSTPTGSQLIGRTPTTAAATTLGLALGNGTRTKTLKRVKVALQKNNGPQVAMPLEREKQQPTDTRANEEKLYPSSSPVLNNRLGSTSTVPPTTTLEATTLTPIAGVSSSDGTSSTTTPASSSPSSTSSASSTPSIVDNRPTTSPTKKTKSKPISRPRILSRLQEKINSLECDIQILPQESHIWRGNETHELMLPIVTPESCKSNSDCTPMVISWEGDAEIQSGDVLLVEINDAMLYPNYQNKMNSGHTTQVYQVTRSGHEHCDVTEGILLDITPLVVDGRKLVTLYDKDLTEGINLLIVVSELWGAQCIRLKVTMKSDNCGENADCSGKGVCYSNESMEGYECQCCGGFAGPHCEEIDACSPSPCTNNGICVDLSQGHEGNAYQCLCPYGYTGKNCQYESDPCNPAECMNGGSCVGNASHFRCDCAPGYTGPLCQHNLNECESSPCVHGICVDQEDGFRCFCQPGFAGELCNFEYNECESNPCLNGAECIDQIGSFECRCSKGYIGTRCEIKVDFCANKPCPEGHRCIDHGDDFSCECPGGRNGPDCNQIPRTQCNVNPCTHGGTCWSSGDSFYCACRPGYTGTMCEDEFVVETVVSSSEFMVDDTSARNFNDKAFGSVVLKSPIELHNAYIAAGVLAAAIFIVAVVVTICHCKVNQTYRKFSTRSTSFFPIIGFGRRGKAQKSHKHWLSGKAGNGNATSSNPLKSGRGHVPGTGPNQYHSHSTTGLHQPPQQIHERPFQRHLAMNLENDMYYTVDFSEHSQHSPLIQFLATTMLSAGVTIMDPIALTMIEKYGGDFGRERLFSSIGMAIFSPITGIMIDYSSRGLGYTDYSAAFYTYDILLVISTLSVLMMSLGGGVTACIHNLRNYLRRIV